MTKEEQRKEVMSHVMAAWFHGLKGPVKGSKLKPKEQFHTFIDKTTDSIISIMSSKKKTKSIEEINKNTP